MSSGDQHSLEDNDEKKKKRFKNREEAVRFYVTGVSLCLLLGSFTVFVFLIPFVLDPALATLQGDFSPAAAECRVVSSVYILGVSRWVDNVDIRAASDLSVFTITERARGLGGLKPCLALCYLALSKQMVFYTTSKIPSIISSQ